ncbi:hypothetical protein D3C84_1115040 [compost metagenome]
MSTLLRVKAAVSTSATWFIFSAGMPMAIWMLEAMSAVVPRSMSPAAARLSMPGMAPRICCGL